MSDAIGQRGSIKRAGEYLGEAVDGAIQIETRGGLLKTTARAGGLGLVGKLAVQGGMAARDAHRKRQQDAPSAEPMQIPRWAVLAVTSSTLHIVTASDTGRMKRDAASIAIPFLEIADVVIDEKRVITNFEVQIRSGQVLQAETKRLGVNRHNTEVLRLLQARVTNP